MHVDCWIQQVTTRVGAVTCWIQQSVSPKQVVGFSCLFNSEVDQLISKVIVCFPIVYALPQSENMDMDLGKWLGSYFRIRYTGGSNNLLGLHRLLDPTSHCTNYGSDLLDPTVYMHFKF